MEPSLSDLIVWAKGAGEILRDGYGKRHQVNHKGRIDLTTEIDQQSEAYLIGQIRSHFPDHAIDSEESGLLSGGAHSCWYIDPLDGTTNYAHAIPIFAVSLAYAEAGKVQIGIVYDPMRDECFSAQRGQGAWLNGEPIHVSVTKEMVRALFTTGFPYDSYPDQRNNLAAFTHFTRISQGVRRLGAAAIDLCYVAAGRVEGYWEQTIKAWDIAAGALIVEEAGGRAAKLDENTNYLQPPFSILAGNPSIFKQMQEEFRKIQ